MKKKNTISRRQFLSYSAMAGAVGALGVPSILTSCARGDKSGGYVPLKAPGNYYIPELPDKAEDGKLLVAGVIGCGGRGSGAAVDFLNAAPNVTIGALGDVFADRVQGLKENLMKDRGIDVPVDKCFTGFDSYKQVIDSGVDMVIIATPPGFRPLHFKYATEKGIHSFLEKPIAVDPEGYRSIMATSKQAIAKGLCVVTGTQRHHQRSYVASYQKIMEGYIGEITGGNVYWNQPQLWYRNKEKGWTDMEWMIRDWVNWKWLSGDHIVEQHVHNIDVFTWMTGLKAVSATGFGSRQRRVTGDQYDNFSVDFVMDNGVHMHSMCRQINGCSDNVSEFIQGSKGSWYGSHDNNHYIKDLQGNVIWKYDNEAAQVEFKEHNPYVLEHVNWINNVRKGTQIMQAEETAVANIAAIMGRQSAYTGKTVTFDEISALSLNYVPENPKLENMDMKQFVVPVTGE